MLFDWYGNLGFVFIGQKGWLSSVWLRAWEEQLEGFSAWELQISSNQVQAFKLFLIRFIMCAICILMSIKTVQLLIISFPLKNKDFYTD